MINLGDLEIYQVEKEAIVEAAAKIDDLGVEAVVGSKKTCRTICKACTTLKV